MKARGLFAVCVGLVAVAAVLSAQQAPADSGFGAKLQAAGNDSAAVFKLAMEEFKAERYMETRQAAEKLLSIDTGDTRGQYLKQAAEFYGKGSYIAGVAIPPPVEPPVTPPGTPPVTPPVTPPGTPPVAPGGPKAANVISLTDAEVEAVYKDFGNQRMAQFKTLQNTLLLRRCATEVCHGNVDKSGAFYMKTQNAGDRKTVAENFKAMMNYVNNAKLADSRILAMAIAPREQHPGGPAMRERDAQYAELKNFITALPGLFGP